MNAIALLLLSALSSPVFAQDPPKAANAAECQRLDTEMAKLAARNAWSGVNANYTGSVAQNGEKISGYVELGCSNPNSLLDAALAARSIGDIRETLQRLLAAKSACKSRAASGQPCDHDLLAQLDSNAMDIVCGYGPADPPFTITKKRLSDLQKAAAKQGATMLDLIVGKAGPYFAPEKNKPLEFANRTLMTTLSFGGWLVADEYTVDGAVVAVSANPSKYLGALAGQCPKSDASPR